MENEFLGQNLKYVPNNPNPASPPKVNILINSKNNPTIENNPKTQLKLGQFMLTPLEGLILNKKMPRGFKFEKEENLLKFLEISKNSSKRIRLSDRYSDLPKYSKPIKNQLNEEKNNSNKEKEREHQSNNHKKLKKTLTKKESPIGNNNNNMNNITNNSEAYKIKMKCYSCFNKIKSNQISNFFYQSKFPNAPCLSMIEKKINNFEYKNVNDFCDDLRKLWNFQFKHYAKEPNIYQNICKMSLLSDQICKELNNEKVNEIKKDEISNIKKRTDKIKKDLNEIKVNNQTNEVHNKVIKKNLEEINNLSHLIRSLTKEQLRGIIPIVADKNDYHNGKSFEFDLEQLPSDKYKRLEEYVYSCKNNKMKNNTNKVTNKEIKNDNKNKNNYEGEANKDKINMNKNNNLNNNLNNNTMNNKNNNNNINKNINNNKQNVNINGSGDNNNGQINQNKKKEEKKIVSEKKSFSDSDSGSSISSLSN